MIDANDASIANWICSPLAIVILLARLILTRFRSRTFDISSLLCVISLLILTARMIVNLYYLEFGTSNDVLDGNKDVNSFSAVELEHIKTGSILALFARLLITTFYWLQICLLLLFYTPITSESGWARPAIRVCWFMIVTSYIAVIFATFLECHPFKLYWQITPPPGRCVRAYVQVFMQCIANIILDLLLLVIAFPVLKVRNRSCSQSFRIGLLFGMGFFCIIVNCIRVGYIYTEASLQSIRSFWASIQILVAAFVANMPTTYGCYQVLRRQKSESITRRSSVPEQWHQLVEPAGEQGQLTTPYVTQNGTVTMRQEVP